MVRRIILSLTAIFLGDLVFVQIISFEVLSQYTAYYLVAVKPFQESKTNTMEIFNEIMIFTLGATSMTLIGRATTIADRETQGQFLIYLLLFKIGVNIAVILHSTLKDLYYKLKRCWAKCTAKKAKENRIPEELRYKLNDDPS